MKPCLILAAAYAVAASAHAAQGAAPHPPPADAKPVSSRAQAQQPVQERHLSEQQRAELRRQLQQFNQQYTRRQ
jgi:Spy/CpxP family protein refolding chaperone